MPSSSNVGKSRDGKVPARSTGRTFAAIDPERVREVVPVAERAEQPPAKESGRRTEGAARARQAGEGGSGRR